MVAARQLAVDEDRPDPPRVRRRDARRPERALDEALERRQRDHPGGAGTASAWPIASLPSPRCPAYRARSRTAGMTRSAKRRIVSRSSPRTAAMTCWTPAATSARTWSTAASRLVGCRAGTPAG